ncbi:transposase [Streptomyces lavendulae]|uniref:transposase n=1 Tax=Streptomyces lavendulae TaxID=1914 RepID=UPI003F4D61AE
MRYVVDNGVKWRAMPADFPPWERVYAFFRRWPRQGLDAAFHDRLRGRVRISEGRAAEPTAGIIDSPRHRRRRSCAAASATNGSVAVLQRVAGAQGMRVLGGGREACAVVQGAPVHAHCLCVLAHPVRHETEAVPAGQGMRMLGAQDTGTVVEGMPHGRRPTSAPALVGLGRGRGEPLGKGLVPHGQIGGLGREGDSVDLSDQGMQHRLRPLTAARRRAGAAGRVEQAEETLAVQDGERGFQGHSGDVVSGDDR